MTDEQWKYVKVDESQVNPKLLEYMEQVKDEYRGILGDQFTNGSTLEEQRAEMDAFYARVAEGLHVNNPEYHTELATLYMYVHNMVRESKNNLKKRFSGTIYTRVHKTRDGEEGTCSQEDKEEAIRHKKPYTDYKSKKSILKIVLPQYILDEAYARLYPNNTEEINFERD